MALFCKKLAKITKKRVKNAIFLANFDDFENFFNFIICIKFLTNRKFTRKQFCSYIFI